MKLFTILLANLLFLNFWSYANTSKDSIESVKGIQSGYYYLTLSDSRTRLERWQMMTGRFITQYNIEGNHLIDFFIWEEKNQVIGLTKEGVVFWDIYSGEALKNIKWPEPVGQLLTSNYEYLDLDKSATFDKNSGRLAVSSGKHLLVINLIDEDIIYSEFTDYIVERLSFMNLGQTLVLYETISNRVYNIDLSSKREKTLLKGPINPAISSKVNGTNLILMDGSSWIKFDESFEEINSGNLNWWIHPSKVTFLGNSDLVCYTTGISKLNYLLTTNKYETGIYNSFDIAGFTSLGGYMLFWNNTSISVQWYTGDQLFYTENYRQGLEQKIGLTLGDTVVLLSGGIKLMHENPVTVVKEVNEKIISGDLLGNIYVWNSNGQLETKNRLLSESITAIHAINDHQFIGASTGRAVMFDMGDSISHIVYRGHKGVITNILQSPDKRYLYTIGQDNKVIMWLTKTGALAKVYQVNSTLKDATISNSGVLTYRDSTGSLLDLENIKWIDEYENPPRKVVINSSHSDHLTALEFNKKGNSILTCDMDGIVKVWDTKTLLAKNTFSNDPSATKAIFSYDGAQIINFSNTEIYVNDALTGKLIKKTSRPDFYKDLAFHDAVSVSNDNTILFANNINNDQVFYLLNSDRFFYLNNSEHEYSPYGIAVHPDGEIFATLSSDGIHIRSIYNSKLISKISQPNSSSQNMYVVRKLKYSPDGKLLGAEIDKDILIYNTEDNSVATRLQNCSDFIFIGNDSVAYISKSLTRRGERLVIGKVISSNKVLFEKLGGKGSRTPMMLDYDSTTNLIIVASQRDIESLIDAHSGRTINSTSFMESSRATGAFHPITGYLAFAVKGGIKMMDWRAIRESGNVPYNRRNTKPSITFTKDGNQMIISDLYGGTHLLDPLTNEERLVLPGTHKLKTSKDSKLIALQKDFYGAISIYEIESGAQITEIEIENATVNDFVFSPDNNGVYYILRRYKSDKELKKLGKYDKKVDDYLIYYDLVSGVESKSEKLQFRDVLYLTISDDGKWLAFKSDYRTIILLGIEEGNHREIKHDNSFDFISFVKGSKYLLIGDDDGRITLKNLINETANKILEGHNSSINTISLLNNKLSSFSNDGSAIIWDIETGKKLVQVSVFGNQDYLFINDNNFYSGTKGISSSVFFKDGDKVFPFEQFDLIYNRPDLVVAGLGGSPERVEAYHNAYLKRLSNMGLELSQISEIELSLPIVQLHVRSDEQQTDNKSFQLQIEAKDSVYTIDRLNLWVNNVAIYGMHGVDVREESTNHITQEFDFPLSIGRNTIQISCHNEKGIESLRESIEITYNPQIESKPNLYIVTLSVSDYKDSNYSLTYAKKDGEEVAKLLGTNTDSYENIYYDTLFDENVTLENFASIKPLLMNSKVDDQVVVFASGHGLLDDNYDFYFGSYDLDFKDPAARGISYDAIEGLLDGIPARKKLLLIDACFSGEVDKEGLVTKVENSDSTLVSGWNNKGVTGETSNSGLGLSNSFELMQELFANLSRGSGAVVISAAAGDSYALESDQWQNGVFTYCIKSALGYGGTKLMADLNNDGQVTVTELKDYVSTEVEKLTKGRQKPTSRRENLEFDFVIKGN